MRSVGLPTTALLPFVTIGRSINFGWDVGVQCPSYSLPRFQFERTALEKIATNILATRLELLTANGLAMDAIAILENMGLNVTIIGRGIVRKQS